MKLTTLLLILLGLYGCCNPCKADNAEDIVTYTLLAEARCQLKDYGQEPLLAIGQVILNRSRERQMPCEAVCLQRRQFSCWNDKDALYSCTDALMSESKEATELAQSIAAFICNNMDVHTTKADHYYNASLCDPSWARGVDGEKIGDHTFLEL